MNCWTGTPILQTYLEWLESQVSATGIDQQYVPLAFQKREFNPRTRTYESDTYDEDSGWLEGYLDQWTDDVAKRHISILGEFGMGKTWSALHYAWRQLQRYQDAKQRGRIRPRLPLYIPLHEYPIKNIETLVAKFFSRYRYSGRVVSLCFFQSSVCVKTSDTTDLGHLYCSIEIVYDQI